jgi:hypothetical protein
MVLTAATLDTMKPMLDGLETLPPLLLSHHRNDACFATMPQSAERFAAWVGGTADRDSSQFKSAHRPR